VQAQSRAVKRAQVEFHKFASLGEPERAIEIYANENASRGALIRKHLEFIGSLTPFLEIGANAGHTSYMLANEFGADGFALDISADALRYGAFLQDCWKLSRTPVRVAGDALNLPFRDGSLRFVLACQMLSQFMDIESVFVEVKRVLAPGGTFFFVEEPLRRSLSLRLYRCPYSNLMKPWERKLYAGGLLEFLVRDVVGARQEEAFGIRQNHTMGLKDWNSLITKHFAAREYDIFVIGHGWGNGLMKKLAVWSDPHRSVWRAARLLGGTLTAACRKAGDAPASLPGIERFESLLRCPDCGSGLGRDREDTLGCAKCGYAAPNEGGVYNLLRSSDRRELYPGDRADIIDFCHPGHESHLLEGWHALEGVFGNKFRWIGPRASARLRRVDAGPQRLRVRGHAHESAFAQRGEIAISVMSNGIPIGRTTLDRAGLFIFEADLPDAPEYIIEISASPAWSPPGDSRVLTVTVSMLRLVPKHD
jgi:ubiquinone/menaquinone biosynthesis C-methylase UbiE